MLYKTGGGKKEEKKKATKQSSGGGFVIVMRCGLVVATELCVEKCTTFPTHAQQSNSRTIKMVDKIIWLLLGQLGTLDVLVISGLRPTLRPLVCRHCIAFHIKSRVDLLAMNFMVACNEQRGGLVQLKPKSSPAASRRPRFSL